MANKPGEDPKKSKDIVNAQGLEALTAAEDGEVIVLEPEVRDAIERTRKAMFVLFVGVGGTGAEVFKKLIGVMQARGVNFGETFETRDGFAHPDAIFIDTDITNGTVDSEDERKNEQDKTFEDMGIKVVKLTAGADRKAFMLSKGLQDKVTLPAPPDKRDPRGAAADPRSALAEYLAVRERRDEKNPIYVAEQIVDEWRSSDEKNPYVGSETRIISVGGAHGGTGPIQLPIVEEIAKMMREKLGATDTQLAKIRFFMSGESSATIKDGLQRKRGFNSVATMMQLLAMYAEKEIKLTPVGPTIKDLVPGADFSFVVDGDNGVKKFGKHYDGAAVIGEAVADELFGGSKQSRSARNNARPSSPDLGGEVDLAPHAILSSIGSASLRPEQDIEVMNLAKRQYMFTRVVGLLEPDMDTVRKKSDIALPMTILKEMLMSIRIPAMDAATFGEAEEIPGNVERESNNFLNTIRRSLPDMSAQSMAQYLETMKGSIDEQLQTVKRTKGLNTAIAFIEDCVAILEEMSADANKSTLTGNFSKNKLTAFEENIGASIKEIRSFKKRPWTSKPELERWKKMAAQLAETESRYAEFLKNRMYLEGLDSGVINPLKNALSAIQEELNNEKLAAKDKLGHADEYPSEWRFEKPLDVKVAIAVKYGEDPNMMRSTYFENGGDWTPEQMEALMEAIQISTLEDTNLLEWLKDPNVVQALEKNSKPLMRPASFLSAQALRDHTKGSKTVTVPVNNAEDAEATPRPNGFTPAAVGEQGAYTAKQEMHGINPLDTAYNRETFKEFLNLPASFELARRFAEVAPHEADPNFDNQDRYFMWKGMGRKLVVPWSKALAQREWSEAGQEGEVAQCPTEDCRNYYFRTLDQVKTETGNKCPCCAKILGDEPVKKEEGTDGKQE